MLELVTSLVVNRKQIVSECFTIIVYIKCLANATWIIIESYVSSFATQMFQY